MKEWGVSVFFKWLIMKKLFITITIISFLFTFLLPNKISNAGVYKFKDENGVWRYTDTPSSLPENAKLMENLYEASSVNLEKQFLERYTPKNDVERACFSAVIITTSRCLGTGFFITEDGYILTNKHVICGLDQSDEVDIELIDRTKLTARVIAISADFDIALLRVFGCKTPFMKPFDYRQMAKGDTVYAIGNPKGLMYSVSSGVLSGYGKIKNCQYIQTDTPINSGNSGGPLITREGEVIGINTWKLRDPSQQNSFEGLGFAIPIKIAIKEFKNYL